MLSEATRVPSDRIAFFDLTLKRMASLTLPEEERNTVLRLFVIRFKIWMAKDSQLVDVIIGSRTTTPGSLSADDRDPRKLMEPDVEKQFEVFPRKNAIESIP